MRTTMKRSKSCWTETGQSPVGWVKQLTVALVVAMTDLISGYYMCGICDMGIIGYLWDCMCPLME